jgi:xanthine dehydrogenase accessory factor
MYNVDQQVLEKARDWAEAHYRFALVTVVQTWGSAPRPVGSWMVLREDGQVYGAVSGGCIEEDLIERIARGNILSNVPFLLTYGVTKEEANRYGLPCGGTLKLLIEPMPGAKNLNAVADWVRAGQLVRRHVVVGEHGMKVELGVRGEKIQWDGVRLTTTHGPDWRMLIVGAGQISEYLAQMGQALGYKIFVCDPRVEYSGQWNVKGTTLLTAMPDDAAAEIQLDQRTAVVALTHDPKLDDLVLLEALKSQAFYVGALGSTTNSERRKQRLLEHFDLSPVEVDRLHGPVGLAIGSKTPPEIAIAILAEMTATRNNVLIG